MNLNLSQWVAWVFGLLVTTFTTVFLLTMVGAHHPVAIAVTAMVIGGAYGFFVTPWIRENVK